MGRDPGKEHRVQKQRWEEVQGARGEGGRRARLLEESTGQQVGNEAGERGGRPRRGPVGHIREFDLHPKEMEAS